jgi:hypothetical protein
MEASENLRWRCSHRQCRMGGEIDIDVPSGGQLTFKLPSVAGYAEPSVGKRSLVFGEQSSLTIGFARCGHLSKRFLHAEIFEHLPTLFHGLRRQDGEASSLEKRSGGKARFGKNSPEPLSFCLRLDRHQEQTGCANALIIGMDKHHIQVPVGLQIRKSDRYAPTLGKPGRPA